MPRGAAVRKLQPISSPVRGHMPLGDTPFERRASTWFSSVVVFPVPGGPKYLNIFHFQNYIYLIPKGVQYLLYLVDR